MTTTFDFQDGKGLVPAYRHINPNGNIGGWVAATATVASTAYVDENAWVFHNARVYGYAHVSGNSRISGVTELTSGTNKDVILPKFKNKKPQVVMW